MSSITNMNRLFLTFFSVCWLISCSTTLPAPQLLAQYQPGAQLFQQQPFSSPLQAGSVYPYLQPSFFAAPGQQQGAYPKFVPYFEAQLATNAEKSDDDSAQAKQRVPLLVSGPYFYPVPQQSSAAAGLQSAFNPAFLQSNLYAAQQAGFPLGSPSENAATFFQPNGQSASEFLDTQKESMTMVLKPEDNRATLPEVAAVKPKMSERDDPNAELTTASSAGDDDDNPDDDVPTTMSSDDVVGGDESSGTSTTLNGTQECSLIEEACRRREVLSQLASGAEGESWVYAVDWWVDEPAAKLYMGTIEMKSESSSKTAGLYYWLRPDGHLQKVYYNTIEGQFRNQPVVVENFTPASWTTIPEAPTPVRSAGSTSELMTRRSFNRFETA